MTSIKTTRLWYKNDPYVLALQAQQVFYLSGLKIGADWRVVKKFKHKHLYDCKEKDRLHDTANVAPVENVACQDSEPEDDYHEVEMTEADETSLHRTDVADEVVSVTVDNLQELEHDSLNDDEDIEEFEGEVELVHEDWTDNLAKTDSGDDEYI